jgi:DNA helicase-2/ATP-dependent DNA helicase PcrA
MNDMNFELIKVLAKNKNIMAVADTKQCIYKFRGANPTVVNRFITEFGAHELFLTKNFRSNTSIVDIANDTVVRQEEKMQSNSTDKGSVIYYEFQTHVEELQWLAKSIKNIVKP